MCPTCNTMKGVRQGDDLNKHILDLPNMTFDNGQPRCTIERAAALVEFNNNLELKKLRVVAHNNEHKSNFLNFVTQFGVISAKNNNKPFEEVRMFIAYCLNETFVKLGLKLKVVPT